MNEGLTLGEPLNRHRAVQTMPDTPYLFLQAYTAKMNDARGFAWKPIDFFGPVLAPANEDRYGP